MYTNTSNLPYPNSIESKSAFHLAAGVQSACATAVRAIPASFWRCWIWTVVAPVVPIVRNVSNVPAVWTRPKYRVRRIRQLYDLFNSSDFHQNSILILKKIISIIWTKIATVANSSRFFLENFQLFWGTIRGKKRWCEIESWMRVKKSGNSSWWSSEFQGLGEKEFCWHQKREWWQTDLDRDNRGQKITQRCGDRRNGVIG